MKAAVKNLASLESPTIGAIINGLFRLPDRASAAGKLEEVRKSFIVSSRHCGLSPDSLVLWVRGFAISEQEAQEGYTGHFAVVTVEKSGKIWRLTAEKLPEPLQMHPQRRYAADKAHPNWGHPILRRIKQGKPYATAEEAQAALMALHEQYPHASIPNVGKLYLMVYGELPPLVKKEAQGQAAVRKYVLEIKAQREGGCIIAYRLNTRSKGKATAKPEVKDGFFSTMVKARRSGRKPVRRPRPTADA